MAPLSVDDGDVLWVVEPLVDVCAMLGVTESASAPAMARVATPPRVLHFVSIPASLGLLIFHAATPSGARHANNASSGWPFLSVASRSRSIARGTFRMCEIRSTAR
jgi:hypothetical protein